MRDKKPNRRIADLEKEISRLTNELIGAEQWNQVLQENYEDSEQQRVAYRRLLKYHTLVLIIMSLLSQYTDANDMGRAIEININRYYKGLTSDIMNIPGDDTIDNFEDESFDDDEEYGTEPGEEEL